MQLDLIAISARQRSVRSIEENIGKEMRSLANVSRGYRVHLFLLRKTLGLDIRASLPSSSR